MPLDRSFLRNAVARRIFSLFVVCALVPIVIMAVLSYTHVGAQLEEQCFEQLYQNSKTTGMTIYERLFLLEDELLMFRSFAPDNGLDEAQGLDPQYKEHLAQHFSALYAVLPSGEKRELIGEARETTPELGESQRASLRDGNTVLLVKYGNSALQPTIFLIHLVESRAPDGSILIGRINADYLWGTGELNTLPVETELTVLDHVGQILVSTVPLPDLFRKHQYTASSFAGRTQFAWTRDGEEYLATAWTMFLKGNYQAPSWSIILSRSKADAMAPLRQFQKIFPRAILMSFGVILLLSLVQIRKKLVPLEKLRTGIAKLARRDFGHNISVNSGDEFQDLAESINEMAGRLHRQFDALEAIAEIDRSVLSSVDTEALIETALAHIYSFFSCHVVGIGVLHPEQKEKWVLYTAGGESGSRRRSTPIEFSWEDMQFLASHKDSCWVDDVALLPSPCRTLTMDGGKAFLFLPLRHGCVILGYTERPVLSDDDFSHARHLADQVAIALSNAQLVDELGRLHWGTVLALARTVDAKSSWTAGHSERVAKMAFSVGQRLGLDDKTLENLKRAALLHDIGKIGVPAAILDKPATLDESENAIIRKHAETGARILEPIPAYSEVVPIVHQHHEYYNGQGYPAGLSGDKIVLGARILAVADVYDALSSDRPYRDGLSHERAIEFIGQGAGGQFDPEVVRVFLELMEWESRSGNMTAGSPGFKAGF